MVTKKKMLLKLEHVQRKFKVLRSKNYKAQIKNTRIKLKDANLPKFYL